MKQLLIGYLLIIMSLNGVTQEYETDELTEIPLTEKQEKALLTLVDFGDDFEFDARNDAQFYSPSTLYHYINGAADLYLQFNFVGLLHQEYTQNQAEVIVDIYEMDSVRNTFGIYAAERSSDYQFIDIGMQGYSDQFSLNFWKGNYYIKLSAFADNDEHTEKALKSMSIALDQNIKAKPTWPDMVDHLPKEGLVENSISLVNQSPLGFEYLSPAWVAAYQWGDQESTLYISESESHKDALQRMEKLLEFIKKTGEIEEKHGGYTGKNDYQGELFMKVVNDWLVILLNPSEEMIRQVVALDK